ncbi:MAG: hypothetical protein ACLR3R_20235 [Clostridium paraputrificum]
MIEFLIIFIISTVVIGYVSVKNFTHKTYEKILYNDEIGYESEVVSDGDLSSEEDYLKTPSETPHKEDLIEEELIDDSFTESDISIDSDLLIKEILRDGK